jgi:hypothetical protein
VRFSVVLAAQLVLAACAWAAQTFEGAWFRIAYPDGFVASGSLPGATADGYDSAFFREPSGRVEFYVYSPQWGGEARDAALDPLRERLVAANESRSATRIVRWSTYRAADGSYARSLEDSRSLDNTEVRVFAIKYRTQADLDEYRDEYQAFKNSLEAYAD